MMILLSLSLFFGELSLLAVGGVTSALPEIFTQVVQIRHWMSAQQFAQLYGIAQAAPGPNMLIVALIGTHLAGITGGLTAMASFIGPSGLVAIGVSRLWDRFHEAPWRRVAQAALLPVTSGLILAAAAILVRHSDQSVLTGLITAGSAYLSWQRRRHPLWLLGSGALIGLLVA